MSRARELAEIGSIASVDSTYLRLASGTGGIQFGGDTAAANALDDYEEGTFTPVLADAATGGNTASGTFEGYYTKVGRVVVCYMIMPNINTTGMTAGNTLWFRNLPFTGLSGANGIGSCFFDGINFSGFVSPLSFGGQTYGDFRQSISGSGDATLTVAAVTGTTSDIFISVTYQAA